MTLTRPTHAALGHINYATLACAKGNTTTIAHISADAPTRMMLPEHHGIGTVCMNHNQIRVQTIATGDRWV